MSAYACAMLSSLFVSADHSRAWSIRRAALYGAALGALAALCKTLGPLHEAAPLSSRLGEIAGITFLFALLCAGAAVLRNVIVRRIVWPD